MKKVLFAYTSSKGHVLKILKNIESNFKTEIKVDYYNILEKQKIDLAKYDHIVVASSIHYGKYHKDMYNFVAKNKELLNAVSNTFLSVNLTARKEGKDIPETSVYIKKFNKTSQWTPQNVVMFAGALEYPKYNFIDKQMIRFIMFLTKGETNPTKIVEYTDWAKVKDFAVKLEKEL